MFTKGLSPSEKCLFQYETAALSFSAPLQAKDTTLALFMNGLIGSSNDSVTQSVSNESKTTGTKFPDEREAGPDRAAWRQR